MDYKVIAPEGFTEKVEVIDGVTTVSFVPVKKLPTTLAELASYLPERAYWINQNGEIVDFNVADVADVCIDELADKNIINTEEYAKAFVALMLLIRYRDAWNEGWAPDWQSDCEKHIIAFIKGKISYSYIYYTQNVLVFKTAEYRDEFLVTFKDLIETAKPLL